jgi:hypothetical protein
VPVAEAAAKVKVPIEVPFFANAKTVLAVAAVPAEAVLPVKLMLKETFRLKAKRSISVLAAGLPAA